MATYTDRVDLYGTIIWTPAIKSSRAADRFAALLHTITVDNDCGDLRSFARALDVHGGSLVWRVDHFGENDTYTVLVRAGTWLWARLDEMEEED